MNSVSWEDFKKRLWVDPHLGWSLDVSRMDLAPSFLGAAGLPYEPRGEAVEDDDATTWHIDYMYDIGLIIGGGTSQIQKNIISERGLGMPREPKLAAKEGA